MAKAPIEIRSLARKHTEEALERLVYWMRSDNPKASVSSSAALLERGWGKPVQPHDGDGEGGPIQFARIVRTIVRPEHSDG